MQGTVYSKETGEIYVTMYGPDELSIEVQLPLYENATYTLGLFLDPPEWYMPGGKATARPKMELTVSATRLPVGETLTISGIPKNTRVIVRGVDEIVTDGTLEWSSAFAGNFPFEFILFPYQNEVVDIEVTNV